MSGLEHLDCGLRVERMHTPVSFYGEGNRWCAQGYDLTAALEYMAGQLLSEAHKNNNRPEIPCPSCRAPVTQIVLRPDLVEQILKEGQGILVQEAEFAYGDVGSPQILELRNRFVRKFESTRVVGLVEVVNQISIEEMVKIRNDCLRPADEYDDEICWGMILLRKAISYGGVLMTASALGMLMAKGYESLFSCVPPTYQKKPHTSNRREVTNGHHSPLKGTGIVTVKA